MGLRTYFQKMNGQEDVSINNAIARRATLKEKKSGGTRIHSFPFRTVFSEDVKFIDAVYEIRDKQNELFRHANYDPTEYFAYRSRTYPQPQKGLTYEPMSLTYQPMTLQEKGLEDLGGIQYKTKWYPNGMTTQAMYLTVMHRPEDNGLDFNFEHQKKAISREELRQDTQADSRNAKRHRCAGIRHTRYRLPFIHLYQYDGSSDGSCRRK